MIRVPIDIAGGGGRCQAHLAARDLGVRRVGSRTGERPLGPFRIV